MASKSSDWRPGPTVCRCCLAEGCYKDISTEYFWMGKREVYAEMLLDALNLSIAYSQSGGPNSNSRLICELCITRLREASEFKRQVQECEKTFMQCLDPGAPNMTELDVTLENMHNSEVKVERVKLEKPVSDDDDFDDRPDFGDDDDDDLDDQPLTKFASKEPKKESVDILDLLDNSKAGVKRKSTSKTKTTPAKKVKLKEKPKKETVKPTTSKSKAPKPTIKLEKKKKGDTSIGSYPIGPVDIKTKLANISSLTVTKVKKTSWDTAIALILNTNACPFKYNGNFLCFYCKTQKFTEMSELIQHTNGVHSNVTRSNLQKLVAKLCKNTPLKINVPDYICNLCNSDLTNFEDPKHHIAGKHKINIDLYNDGFMGYSINGNDCSCIKCDYQINHYRALHKHIQDKHFSIFVCDQCGAGFATKITLKSHVATHSTDAFPCELCGKVYRSPWSKYHHVRVDHLNRSLNHCMYCSETFKSYYSKQQHIAAVHGGRRFTCRYCSKLFISNSNLLNHERHVHAKGEMLKCESCNYSTCDKRALKLHLVGHSGERNYKCEVCAKCFARKKTLTQHMKIHNNDRRFVCQHCDRAFVQNCSLKEHIKTRHRDLKGQEC